MRLPIKIITTVFLIYFIRRCIDAYKALNHANEKPVVPKAQPNGQVINADFKVVD
jgi:hypothetical protein